MGEDVGVATGELRDECPSLSESTGHEECRLDVERGDEVELGLEAVLGQICDV